MPPVVFTLQVPARAPYRPLAEEIAARFVQLSGGDEATAATFGADVSRAADALAAGASNIDLTFSRNASRIDVVLVAGAQTRQCAISL